MKLIKHIVVAGILLHSFLCLSQETSARFSINIPTLRQEATSVWRTINDIHFFEKQGYNVSLPKDDRLDGLIRKSKNGAFGNADYPLILEILESGAYNKNDYLAAIEKVQEQELLINSMIYRIDSLKNNWDFGFKMFDNYAVVFTLYGSGGSYNPETGTITLFTTKKGDFKNYRNPAKTIIHELVHTGIEASIVKKYNLSHTLKERIVDKMVFILFGDLLPDYQIQNMGDTIIDGYLKNTTDLGNLDHILEELTR